MKGMGARIAYNGLQSVVFFSLVMKVGKAYGVNLIDE